MMNKNEIRITELVLVWEIIENLEASKVDIIWSGLIKYALCLHASLC